MIVNLFFLIISLIFIFLISLAIKAIIRGIKAKKNIKNSQDRS